MPDPYSYFDFYSSTFFRIFNTYHYKMTTTGQKNIANQTLRLAMLVHFYL